MKQFFENTRPGGQLLALMLIFVLFFIFANGALVIPFLVSKTLPDMLLMQAVSQLLMFGGTAVVFAWMFYGRPLHYLRMGGCDRLPVKVFVSFIILLLLLPLSDWLTRLNDAMHLPQSMSALETMLREMGERSQAMVEAFLMREGIGALVANLLVLALVPAICEELLFRGAMQQLMVRCLGGRHHWAIIITAAVFSLFHFELFAFLPRFMLGIALGYLFHYGGSLWVNATAHFANNAIVVVLYYLAQKGLVDIETAESINAPWYLAVAGLAVAAVLFWLVFLRSKSAKTETAE